MKPTRRQILNWFWRHENEMGEKLKTDHVEREKWKANASFHRRVFPRKIVFGQRVSAPRIIAELENSFFRDVWSSLTNLINSNYFPFSSSILFRRVRSSHNTVNGSLSKSNTKTFLKHRKRWARQWINPSKNMFEKPA